MSTTSMRASDSERERIVRELTQHCGDGRLTLDELEERIPEAYAAETQADLQHALRELPAKPRTLITSPPRRADVPPVTPARRPEARPPSRTKGRGAEIALRVHLYIFLSVLALLCTI